MKYRVVSDRLTYPVGAVVSEDDMPPIQLARLAAGGHLEALELGVTGALSPADEPDVHGQVDVGLDDHPGPSAEDDPEDEEEADS